jgi:hypothetical protein
MATRDPNTGSIADLEFEAACDPSLFPDLQPQAARAISEAVRSRDEACIAKLTVLGWGFSSACEIQRQILTGGNVGMLFKIGIPVKTARSVAGACTMGHERFLTRQSAAMSARPHGNSGRTFAHKSYRTGSGYESWQGESPL